MIEAVTDLGSNNELVTNSSGLHPFADPLFGGPVLTVKSG